MAAVPATTVDPAVPLPATDGVVVPAAPPAFEPAGAGATEVPALLTSFGACEGSLPHAAVSSSSRPATLNAIDWPLGFLVMSDSCRFRFQSY